MTKTYGPTFYWVIFYTKVRNGIEGKLCSRKLRYFFHIYTDCVKTAECLMFSPCEDFGDADNHSSLGVAGNTSWTSAVVETPTDHANWWRRTATVAQEALSAAFVQDIVDSSTEPTGRSAADSHDVDRRTRQRRHVTADWSSHRWSSNDRNRPHQLHRRTRHSQQTASVITSSLKLISDDISRHIIIIIIIIIKAMRLTWYKCKSTARLRPRYNTRGYQTDYRVAATNRRHNTSLTWLFISLNSITGSIGRITNAGECWHSRLQALFQCQHPTLWTFVQGIEKDLMQRALFLQGIAGARSSVLKQYKELKVRVQNAVDR